MTRHPVDSTTRACCAGIGGHTQDCNPVARMTPGEQATYRRLTRRYGQDGIVRALTADFTDHGVGVGCTCVERATAAHGDSHRAQADPEPGDVHPARGAAGSATQLPAAAITDATPRLEPPLPDSTSPAAISASPPTRPAPQGIQPQ